ncbi:E3 ubiquitin-protein ligase MBR1 [Vitis vinifera]|uniref:RING-type E3 ubiquitin transferase n=1 Tax=Vitis vinifera TaxID=29760 RepID=A0A438DWP8_VITVI|nr:E3 ubiquitin-protein ligase MBR1 [Vitis vinifera]
MFEGDHDQTWNHMNADQPYLARAGVAENVSLIYPVENMTIDGGHYSSHWNPPPRPNVYSSSGHNVEVPHYQQDALGPSRDPFLHLPAAGTFPMGPENYAHHASSSNYDRQTFHGMDNGFVDLTMGNEEGHTNEKALESLLSLERGSTSRFYSAGSSSDLSVSADLRQEKPNADSQNMPWDHINMSPGYRGSGLSIGGEGSLRNPSHGYSSSVDLSSQSSNSSSREWNHILSPAHGRTPVSDTSGLSHETNHFPLGSCTTNAPVEFGGYNHDFIPSRNPMFLKVCMGWRNSDRNGRSRISNERFRSLSDEAGVRERLASEGLMIVDRSALYGSRNLFDQHREMRLDVDNMSYEELLALGERIGNVNTGLSEDMMSKCLTETIYCSSDQLQEEGACVICLDEYKNMDDVGTLSACRHDYHVDCIKKWLLMKNSCPICKAPALPDHMKGI